MYTIWITGLSQSGKTTIAKKLVKYLRQREHKVVHIDGDVIRQMISFDLGYNRLDRDKHIFRIAGICYLCTSSGVFNVASVVSPTRKMRRYARTFINNFCKYLNVLRKIMLQPCQLDLYEQEQLPYHLKKVQHHLLE